MQSNPLPSETDEILLAQPRGFCAGVDRAINIVNEALTRFGAPIYVRHEIVHNKYVVDELRAKGAIFVNEIEEIPRGAIVIYVLTEFRSRFAKTLQSEACKCMTLLVLW